MNLITLATSNTSAITTLAADILTMIVATKVLQRAKMILFEEVAVITTTSVEDNNSRHHHPSVVVEGRW
jgi:hypothetical protein